MRRTTVVVIGAGHAGLAMSCCLTERSIDHVVLERGEIANSWRTERWASLRLLTPNWQSRLPGCADHAGDPDGFRTMPEVIALIEGYARAVEAPAKPKAKAPRALRAREKAAFTLRLDAERHLRLRLASAVTNRSAQTILTDLLDDYLSALPEIDAMASRLPAARPTRQTLPR